MPRYFFDTKDGHCVRDPEGSILADADAARREGLSLLGELLRDQGEGFWKTGHFSVIVTDDVGAEVVTLTTKATGDAAKGVSGDPHEPSH
ncbi:MAG: hypothetical protein JWR59_1996 [Brevundimonas sp.]|nr:hypothetical protein [Brevundimonas sp.]